MQHIDWATWAIRCAAMAALIGAMYLPSRWFGGGRAEREQADWDARFARGEDPSPDEPGGPAQNAW